MNFRYIQGDWKDFYEAPDEAMLLVADGMGRRYFTDIFPEPGGKYWGELSSHGVWGKAIKPDAFTLIAEREKLAEWDGQGLPPVGCECELSNAVEFYTHSGSTDFDEGTTVVVGGTVNFGLGDFVAVKVKGTNCITDINPCFLRPARPEAVRKRDEAVKEFVRQLIECVDIHAMDKRQEAIVREKLYSMLPTLPGVTVID
ncbi:TPA: hypothetical protein NQG29_003278 [Enterobacter cloacae]|nr:hypothetical protein [Enterobacter cloacae]HCJ0088643.1 hypothetical protein [Enterobacter cloacae]